MRHSLCLAGLVVGLLIANAACGVDEDTAQGSNSALTLDNDRFVVSASPSGVVLKKSVDGASLPWNAEQLRGKAIDIFPIAGITEDGVFARASEVSDEGDTLRVTVRQLTLAEIDALTEDDVLRIKMPDGTSSNGAAGGDDDDSTLDPLPTNRGADAEDAGTGGPASPSGDDDDSAAGDDDVSTQAVRAFLHPLAAGETTTGPSPFATFDLKKGMGFFGNRVSGSVSLKHTINSVGFTPEVLVDGSDVDAIEFGLRGAFDWDSTFTLTGTLSSSGEIFRSQSFTTKPYVIAVPLGPAPVPVALTAEAYVTCSASTTGSLAVTANLKIHADASTSMHLQIHKQSDEPRFSEGQWPNSMGGSAEVTLDKQLSGNQQISCAVPAIKLSAKVGGFIGPYLRIEPTAIFSTSKLTGSFETNVIAGVEAGFSRVKAKAELKVATIK